LASRAVGVNLERVQTYGYFVGGRRANQRGACELERTLQSWDEYEVWIRLKRVKHLIDSGEVTPYIVNVKLNRGELLNPPWTADPKVTGGFLYETPIHLFDICRYLFGEVTTVKCEARQSISQSEFDDFAVLLTFESGTIGTL
jgi:hypothetical protein